MNVMPKHNAQTGSRSHRGILPTDRRLVHKFREENVFIGNLRRALPRTFPESAYLNFINTHGITKPEITRLLSHYTLSPNAKDREPYYFRKSVPEILSVDTMKSAIQNSSLSPRDIKRILKLYRKNSRRGNYYLKFEPEEPECRFLGILLGADRMTDLDEWLLSDIFERGSFHYDNSYFLANMIIDVNHFYFFEHPNEHVPGMMLIEAARQMLMACAHKYGSVPLAGYNFIMSNLEVEFKRYLELNSPMLLIASQTECYKYDTGIWADMAFDVSFFQNETLSSSMKFHFNVVTERVFKRMRAGGNR
jgi:hypothetical protein